MTSVARINWGEKLETKIAMLPESPGCYLMKDAEGTIIYIGKAVNLKNRVRSYFRDKIDEAIKQARKEETNG